MDALGRLAALLDLQGRARAAVSVEALRFLIVNDSLQLLPARQAVLWTAAGRVAALSGVAGIDADAPLVQALTRLHPRLASTAASPAADPPADSAAAPGTADPGGADSPGPAVVRCAGVDDPDWHAWLPAHGLLLDLRRPGGDLLGRLLLARDTPWNDGESTLAAALADAYGHAWHALAPPRPARWWERPLARLPAGRRRLAAGLGLCLAVLLWPVRLTVLAPAEVVALTPTVIRAPADGVVAEILVRPNDTVAAGQALFELDATGLQGQIDVARKTLDTADAELEQAAHKSFADQDSRALIAIRAGQRQQQQAEVAHLEAELARLRVSAPRAGTALLDDPAEWSGRPVAVGERVLQLADPRQVEIEAWIAPADALEFPAGAPAKLFLNADPLHPVTARLRYFAYEALPRPDGTLAYRVRARLDDGGDPPRLGLRGTLRLDGDRVPLGYWLLRRPLAALRQFFAL